MQKKKNQPTNHTDQPINEPTNQPTNKQGKQPEIIEPINQQPLDIRNYFQDNQNKSKLIEI